MTGHELDYPDLAYAIDKGGDDLDGPVTLNNEPSGDAMRWMPPCEDLNPNICVAEGCFGRACEKGTT